MIRQAKRGQARKGAPTGIPRSVPAPIGGWNARDPEAAMAETDATVLENWLPGTGDVQLRKGAENHVTGFAATPKALMAYASATTDKLFAANSSGIYDVSSAGALGAAAIACTSGEFQYTNVTVPGGSYLVAVNGVDSMKRFDGTSWSSITGAITGVTTSDLAHVCEFKKRLWFIKKNSMSAYYLGLDSIAGAATEFPLGNIFSKGGYLVAAHSWTLDGGDGADDLLVFISSKGEVAVYKGTDPSSASTFALVGVYFIGKPLGRSCFIRMGGEVLVLTEAGIYPLSKALSGKPLDDKLATSSKISGAFNAAAQLYGATFGWKGVVLPKYNLLVINYPATGKSKQFVMNTITGAWSLISGWNIQSMEEFGGELYFGTTTVIAKGFSGHSDFGSNIIAKARQAFSYFGFRGMTKHFKLVRPMMRLDKAINLQLGINVDFEDVDPIGTSLFTPGEGAVWDSGDKWDASKWSPEYAVEKRWHTIAAKPGYCAALRLRIASNAATVGWSSTDYIFERGSGL